VTELQARTFATWTLTSCLLCLLCARNTSVAPIYGTWFCKRCISQEIVIHFFSKERLSISLKWFAAATLGSFVIALIHFILELFIYETLTISTAIQPLVIASISSLWMGAGWNYYTKHALAPG